MILLPVLQVLPSRLLRGVEDAEVVLAARRRAARSLVLALVLAHTLETRLAAVAPDQQWVSEERKLHGVCRRLLWPSPLLNLLARPLLLPYLLLGVRVILLLLQMLLLAAMLLLPVL